MDSYFAISCSLKAHSFLSISSIIFFLFAICEALFMAGRVASHARFSRARSIISTSASPAGRPRPYRDKMQQLFRRTVNPANNHHQKVLEGGWAQTQILSTSRAVNSQKKILLRPVKSYSMRNGRTCSPAVDFIPLLQPAEEKKLFQEDTFWEWALSLAGPVSIITAGGTLGDEVHRYNLGLVFELVF